MKNLRIWLAASITLLTLPFSIIADTPDACNPTFNNDAEKYFSPVLDEAKQALLVVCNAISAEDVSEQVLHSKLKEFHDVLQEQARIVMPQIASSLYIYDKPLLEKQGDIASGAIPSYRDSRPDDSNPNYVEKIVLYYQGKVAREEVEVSHREAQACFDDSDCGLALVAYRDVLREVYLPLAAEPLQDVVEYLTEKDKQWGSFIEEARAQTFIDIGLTSTLYEWRYGRSEHDFRSPPAVQWFALRPNVLIENVSDAIDGDQVEESLALELIGFNYWQDACFGYACGASLIVNYADRSSIEDRRFGLMFHVDNSYSFGVTNYAGDVGVFVTVDLLKVFQDKKASFADYKNKYRKLSD